MPPPPRYLLIGGFLGSGKTTAVGKLARHLADRGHRVGLITNDQGRNLADTTLLRSLGFATEEIPGGCFCCRFDALVEASRRLAEAAQPEVFIAEPVGSCTDLAATVTFPLRRGYGADFTVGPVSVLLDPVRALRILGGEPGGRFSPKVVYLYRKQIEEADLVVVNKSDLLEPGRLDALRGVLSREYPGKEIHVVSARHGSNLDAWFSRLMGGEQTAGTAMPVDYAVYAEGEALLGWLNGTVEVASDPGVEATPFLEALAGSVQARLRSAGVEIAHLKMTFGPRPPNPGDVAALSLVRSDAVPELSRRLDRPVTTGQLILNLRAEAAPDVLATAFLEGLGDTSGRFPGLRTRVEHLERFRPGTPTPTHRIATLDS